MLEWLKKRYTQPVVVVQDSAAVDTSCKANGLDLVHLLRPFAVHRGPLYAHLGDRGEAVVSTNFAVRLVRPDCVREVDRRARLHFLRQRMRENAPADLAYGEQLDAILDELLDPAQGTPRPRPMWLSSPSTTATLLQRATSPWHAAFIRDYHFLVRCSPFDTLDYPVGILYALSTHEIMRPGYSHNHTTSSSSDHAAAPAAAESTASVSITVGAERLLQLFQQQSQLPLRAWEDMPGMDTELHRYYLLVHDARLGTTLAEARQLLAVAQRQYGPNNCALLKINSVRDPQDIHSLDPSPWVDANELLCLDVPAMNALVNSGAGPPLCSAAGTPLSAPLTAREGQPSTASNNSTSTSNVVNNASVASTTGSVSNNTESAAHAGHHLSVVVAREAVAVQNTFGKWPNGEPKVTGCFLSPEDLSEVRNVMQYYLGQSLFKYLERRLRMLDLVVEERRTTALGKVASWFRAKEESKPNNHHALVLCRDGTTSVYAASSLEMYMRRCGDLSLALQAYDAAINYYKMCIDELLETLPSRPLNRAFLGGCQEGLAMAHFFLGKLALPSPTPWATGPTRGDVKSRSYVNRLEIAHGDYLLADERPYALRLSFVMYELCRTCHPPAMDRARAALDHLLATGETAHERICAAVAEDLLAGVFLVRNPPRPTGTLMPAQLTESYPIYCYMRSYARHLTAAGLLYKDHNMPAMALRAFLRVLKVLRGAGQRGDWLTLYESTLRVLAELYVLLGKDVQGLVRASVAVAQGSPSYRNTRTGMQNFVAFWQEQRRVLQKIGYALCPHMPVPVLLRRSFAVERRFYHTDATTEREARRIGRELVELEWRGIEDALRRHCQRVWLPTHPAYTFPHFHSDAKPYYLFPPTASPSSAAQHTATKAGGNSNSNNNNNTNSTSSNATTTTTTTPASLIVPNTSKVVGRVVGSARRGGHNDTEDADAHASRAQPSHAEGGGAATATRPVNKTWAATRRSFTIAFGEALQLSVVLRNPVGGPLAVEGLCLLYLSRAQPGQLWRSRSALSIDLAANAEEKVTLDFEPLEKGEYVIVGLCWTLMEQEGYYYFNTRERRAGCAESVYEYAFDQPTPVLEAEENIFVSVTAARARLATRFDPPLPSKLFHGEYFHTQLHITNVSTQCEAGHVLVQRSAANAQFLWIDGYDLQAHMQTAEPMLLAERIRPQETRRFDLTIRAQHDDGGDAAEHCWNHIFLLFSYTPDTAGLERSTSLARRTLSLVDTTSAAAPAAANNTTTTTATNNNNNNNSSTTPLTSTAPLTSTNAMTASHASPVQVALSSSDEGGNVLPGLTSSQAEAASTATTSAAAAAAAHRREKSDLVATVSSHETRAMRGGTALRLHRLLRRYEVRPMMRIHSRVLPPSQSELALVALVTAKHIADIRETPPPMRVTRVMTLQEPGWQVRCGHVASLVQDRAVGCIAFPGGAVTLPLLIHRRPSAADEDGTTKTTANANSSNGEGMSSSEHTLYEETTCLPLAEALPSHNKAAAVIANVGSALATSEMSRYFLRTCVRGPGEVGHVEDGATGLTFYLDRASQQQQKELQLQQQQRRQQRSECTSHTLSVQQQAERSVFGDVLAQYPPLAVAVVWVLDDGQHVRSGQLFHFVDPLDYHASPSALHATRTPGMALAPNNTLSSAAGNHSGSVADDEPSADSLKQQQHKLCTALMERRTAQPGRLHSVAFHVAVPPRVQNTSACPSVARVPVTFTCLSLAPFPLLVEVAAGVWHENKNSSTAAAAPSISFSPSVGNASQVADSIGLGVLFVGQTQQSFVLLPSTTHTAHFVAHILLPGLVDCNAFDVRVVPLCFWPGKGTITAATTATTSDHEEAELAETTHSLGRPQRDGTRRPERGVLYTGMTRGAYLRMLREAASTSSSNNSSTMATCEGVQQGCPSVVAHHTSHNNNNNEEEYAAASPTVVEAQGSAGRAMLSDAELLSRQAPRGVLPSQLLVIGHEQPALTQACFVYASSSTAAESFVDHTESSAVRRRAAAREAEDIRIFQEHYRTFEAAQANAAGPDAQLYVYRPAVKPYVELEPGHTPVAGAQGPAHTAAHTAAMVNKPLTPRPPPIPVHTSLAAETPAREGRVVSELHSETTERSWLQPASVAERDATEQPRPTIHIPTTTSSSNSSDEDEDDDGLLVQAAMAEQDSPASPLRHLPPQTLAGTAWQEAELSESSVTNSTEAAAAANHDEEEEESTTSSETDETTERADTAVAAGTS